MTVVYWNLPNLSCGCGCGFGMGISQLTHPCTHHTHTWVPVWDHKPVMCTRNDEVGDVAQRLTDYAWPSMEDCTLPHMICRIPADSSGFQWIPVDPNPRLCECDMGQICMSGPEGVCWNLLEITGFRWNLQYPTRQSPVDLSSRVRRIPADSSRVQRILADSSGFQWIPAVSSSFQQIPADSSRVHDKLI